MGQSLTAFGLAFLLGVGLSRTFRRSLFWLISREKKVGKEKIHGLFPKPKRPLGGGLAMLVSATVALLVVPRLWSDSPDPAALSMLPLMWAFGLIGLADDLKKTAGRGMDERSKLLLQLVAASAFGLVAYHWGGLHLVRVPFIEGSVDFGAFYAPFIAIVVLATVNAVNLSDGIDGLAGGAVVISLLGLIGIGIVDPQHSVIPVCWPLIGAVMGFLVYNLPPARLLMGDTGALALGGALAALAAHAHVEFWLFLVAAPFVVNAASVVVQMGTVRGLWRVIRPLRYRTTETARPFLCTPLHHHFQWLGWNDWRVLALFWGFGAALSAWSLLSLWSGAVWSVGLLAIAIFLVAAALQKQVRANYFLGLLRRPGESALLALYRGIPVDVLHIPLYRLHYETSITEQMLGGATAESILWRPITEVEAHVVLGKIYADQKLLDQALMEWEQVPMRNLLLRPSVVLRLARIYYGRDRLLEAIKLWEQLPASRLAEMPNVREVVRAAKLRLADLAAKAHRQGMRIMEQIERTGETPERLEGYLLAARRLNQDLLSLLVYERDKLRGRQADPQAARARRELLRRTQNAMLARINDLDEALGRLARTVALPDSEEPMVPTEPGQRAAQELQVRPQDLVRLLAPAGKGDPTITAAAVHPKASRNSVFRINLDWSEAGPASVVVKRYAADRIAFFSACYRRERGVLDLLHSYGCAVPRVYDGELMDQQAMLVMQDLGDETLAERLEDSDNQGKEQWLYSAVLALATLHATAQTHLRDLEREIQKVDKEALGPEYYFTRDSHRGGARLGAGTDEPRRAGVERDLGAGASVGGLPLRPPHGVRPFRVDASPSDGGGRRAVHLRLRAGHYRAARVRSRHSSRAARERDRAGGLAGHDRALPERGRGERAADPRRGPDGAGRLLRGPVQVPRLRGRGRQFPGEVRRRAPRPAVPLLPGSVPAHAESLAAAASAVAAAHAPVPRGAFGDAPAARSTAADVAGRGPDCHGEPPWRLLAPMREWQSHLANPAETPTVAAARKAASPSG